MNVFMLLLIMYYTPYCYKNLLFLIIHTCLSYFTFLFVALLKKNEKIDNTIDGEMQTLIQPLRFRHIKTLEGNAFPGF